MLIVALVLAVIGLAALVTAVVSSNEIVAWVCIGVSAIGVILLVVDAVRDRGARPQPPAWPEPQRWSEPQRRQSNSKSRRPTRRSSRQWNLTWQSTVAHSPSSRRRSRPPDRDRYRSRGRDIGGPGGGPPRRGRPYDEPEFDTYSDDEPEYPPSAEESALHTVDEDAIDESGPDAIDGSALNGSESEQR